MQRIKTRPQPHWNASSDRKRGALRRSGAYEEPHEARHGRAAAANAGRCSSRFGGDHDRVGGARMATRGGTKVAAVAFAVVAQLAVLVAAAGPAQASVGPGDDRQQIAPTSWWTY